MTTATSIREVLEGNHDLCLDIPEDRTMLEDRLVRSLHERQDGSFLTLRWDPVMTSFGVYMDGHVQTVAGCPADLTTMFTVSGWKMTADTPGALMALAVKYFTNRDPFMPHDDGTGR